MSDEPSSGLYDRRTRVDLDGELRPAFDGVARRLRGQLEPTTGGAAVCVDHHGFDMRGRLGDHGVFTTIGSPRDASGHFGFGGSGAWADPHRELAVALIVNSGIGTPFGDLRIARISAAALRRADARPRWKAHSRQPTHPTRSAAVAS